MATPGSVEHVDVVSALLLQLAAGAVVRADVDQLGAVAAADPDAVPPAVPLDVRPPVAAAGDGDVDRGGLRPNHGAGGQAGAAAGDSRLDGHRVAGLELSELLGGESVAHGCGPFPVRRYAEATSEVIGEEAAALAATPGPPRPRPDGPAPGQQTIFGRRRRPGPGCAAAGMLVGQVVGGRDQYSLMSWMARGRSICA